jgi:autoinducer 2 (AI-2) kinase
MMTVDVGSGSGRAAIFDTKGNEVFVAKKEWAPKVIPQYTGSQVFDTTEAWGILSSCVREALAKAQIDPSRVVGVSATSMREGMVLYDRDRREIWACPNVDARAAEEVVEMTAMGIAEELYRTGGDWLNIICPPRFRWIKKHQPEILDRVCYVSMISDWVLFKLSDEIVTDPTVGSSSGLFDLKMRTWSESSIEMCSLPSGIYPPVFESGTKIGKVIKKAAEATGLKEGTPVITGGGDTQLALLGVGNIKPLTWAVVGGTFWQATVIGDEPFIDPLFRPRTLCHVNRNQWMTEAIGFLTGQQARWFRDGFCQEEVRLATKEGVDPYYLMEKLAAQIPPGSNGVIGVFSAVHNSRSWKHAAPSFLNFDISNPEGSGKSACIRALWESAAYTAYENLQVLMDVTSSTPAELMFCGGAAKGFLWPQILADVCGVPVKVPVVKESTSLGCAMCVALGAGLFESFTDAADQWVRVEREFVPSDSVHRGYLKRFERWRTLYAEVMKIANQDLLTPMWRAPGT